MGSILNDGGIAIPHYIQGFPYPERYCPYCEHPLVIEKTCHIQDMAEHFKVIYQCHNRECVFLDNETHYAYMRVYYSSEYAESQLFKMLLRFVRQGRRNDSPQ
jgi:hypothetical protein